MISWLDAFLSSYNQVQNAGVSVIKRQTLNIIGATSIADNPGNESTDVTLPTVAASGPNPVHITSANSPYTLAKNTTAVIDCSGGPVVVNLPTLSLGQWAAIQQDPGTAFSNTITVNAPGGGQIFKPVPNESTSAASIVFDQTGSGTNSPLGVGGQERWINGGLPSGFYPLG